MRIVIIKFETTDELIYEEVKKVLQKYVKVPDVEIHSDKPIILPGLEIYQESRKVLRCNKEIHLTAKEYDLLYFLVVNRGKVLTYEQIYLRVWDGETLGNESSIIGYHICRLRKKLFKDFPDADFLIRCVREVGYCFEVNI